MSMPLIDIKEAKLKAVNLEITSYCNLKCLYCLNPQKEFREKGNAKKELIDKVINELPKEIKIMVCGIGEPSLHPDFLNILLRLSDNFESLSLVTNGNLFMHREFLDAISKMNISKIFLSLDYLSVDDYVLNKKGRIDDLEKIFTGLDYFNKVREKETAIQVNYLFDFIKPIRSYIDCYKRLASILDKNWCIYIRKMKNLAGQVEVGKPFKGLSEKSLDETFKEYICENFVVESWDKYLNKTNYAKELPKSCRHIYSYYMLLWNGDVVPCCMDFNAKMRLFNVFEKNMKLHQLFHSNEYLRFRNLMEKLDYSELLLCQKCEDFYKA
jgi:organic radical activating enzyme